MQTLYKTILILTIFIGSISNTAAQKADISKYKCMVQMTNYIGEGAYIVVSLIDPKGAYEKTLYVLGADKKWYTDLKEWHKAFKKKPTDLSAITGASVTGGDRSVTVLEIENSKIDAGYKVRFESAVENQEYHIKDLEFALTKENLSGKIDGTGFIRYVRFNPN